MTALIDLKGQRFSRWTVLRFAGSKHRKGMWLCRCECGREKIIQGKSLRRGDSRGCINCHALHRKTTHGRAGTRLYKVWQDMIQRCENLNTTNYKYYGGRGIKVYSQWHDPALFIAWASANGYKEDLTIDRIDNDGDYRPENCQFITRSENSLKAWHVDNSYGENRCLSK